MSSDILLRRIISSGCDDNEIHEILNTFNIHFKADLDTIRHEYHRNNKLPPLVCEYYIEFENFPFNVDFRIFRGKPNSSPDDLDAVAPLWNSQHQKAFMDAIEKDGWFWHIGYEFILSSIIEKQIQQMGKAWLDFVTPKNARKYRKNPRMWNVNRGVTYALIDYACCRASKQTQAKELVRSWLRAQAVALKCRLCKGDYSLIDTRQTFYRNLKGQIDFCDHCLGSALYPGANFYIHTLTEKSREPMLIDLRDLVTVSEMVPSSKFLYDFTGRSAYVLRVPRDRWPDLMHILQRIRPVSDYKEQFGSWLKALIAAGLLDNDALETSRGIRCVAADGHECHSLAEKLIDDWLHQAGIPHSREPHYPHHSKYNPNGQKRADWLVRNMFIEYLGLVGEPDYDQKTKTKVKLAKELGQKLICIKPEDLDDSKRLQNLLGQLLQHQDQVM